MNAYDEIEQHDLLPGPSANKWAEVAIVGGVVWIVGTVGSLTCALALVRDTGVLDPTTLSFMGLFVGGLAALAFSTWMMKAKEKKELSAGYTTMAQGHYEVERRHSPTGAIMRRAGQPALTQAQWKAAMAAVRAYEQRSGRGARKQR
ncbi:hypothetical protein [Leifsonia virtsii]|uniref:DUF2530 domain-containing protein n=1 Tax=Leifsonia virtsii TaxID=3035915 RepID=A0ABT8IXS6_9MICO|nr:hypothetical protein [Leifsonia virtsii]MDN4597532.1 hypothetical protein [Leifsonia virtsii]